MRSNKRYMMMVPAVAMLLGSMGATAWAQGNAPKVAVAKTALVQKMKDGGIDWTNQTFYAYGEGAMAPVSQEPDRAKAYMKAKSYARMQAAAHLLMIVKGTRISFEATGKDFIADETIRQQIEGSIRGVEIVEDGTKDIQGGTIVYVKVATKMYGVGKPASILLSKEIEKAKASSDATTEAVKVVIPKAQPAPKPAPSAPKVPSPTPAPAPVFTPSGNYTSVIIDTRGLNISRAISPKVRRKDGTEVWGTMRVDPNYAIETGIVSYVRSLDDAKKNRRCGDNPLVIKAIGRGDRAAACDPVITEEDAKRLLAENDRTKFMDKCNVIFLVDPNN